MKLLLSLLPLFMLTGCAQNGDKTSLVWCVFEIQKSEGYEECSYTYQDVLPQDYKFEKENNIDCFIITTYTETKRTEWACVIEYTKTLKRYLNRDDIYRIDCDVVWEVPIL